MKKLLFLLFLIPSFVFGQVALPDGILNQNPVPVDRIQYNTGGTVYTNTAQVLAQVPAGKRFAGQMFLVGNPFQIYTFASAADLASGILTVFGGGGGGSYTSSNGITLTGSNFTLGGALTANTSINGGFNLQFGTTTPLNRFDIETTNGIAINAGNTLDFSADEIALISNSGGGFQFGASSDIIIGNGLLEMNGGIGVQLGASTSNSDILGSNIQLTSPNATTIRSNTGVNITAQSGSVPTLRIFKNPSLGTASTSFIAGNQASNIDYILPTSYPATNGDVLSSTTAGVMSWVPQSGGGGGSALSALTAATTTNTISNVNFTQTWSWGSLTSNSGLVLSATGTAAATGQTVLDISSTGANATSGVGTNGIRVSNTHSGTGAVNNSITTTATGGSENNALYVGGGDIKFAGAGNIVLDATTGTKIGTSTSQKLAFYNSTPVVKPSAVTTSQGIADALTSVGLLPPSTIAGGASNLEFAKIGQVGKSKFDVTGYAIIRMRTNTGSPGGGNLYLTYELLTPSDAHDSHFIYSAFPDPSTGKVVVNFPYMKTVYRGNVDTDDRLGAFGFKVGSGVDTYMMQGYLNFPTSASSLVKLSTVTSTPTAIPGLTPVTNISVNSGIFTITGGSQWYQQFGAIQVKPGLKTGVAIYNNEDNAMNQGAETKFSLRDALGNKITSFDSNNDGDFMWVVLPFTIQTLDGRYYNSAFWPDDIGFESTAVALFCEVSGEAYMIASPSSSTSVLAEWQAFPGATDYQLYRSLKSASSVDLTTGVITFGTETQVYTGTGFSYSDSGLSANTVYYYHLKGTVSGTPNTDMTFFDVKTNP